MGKKKLRNIPADTNVSKEREGGGTPSTRAEITLQPVVKQVVPLQLMEGHVRADIHTAVHGGPHTGAGEQHEEEGEAERNCYGLTGWYSQ